MGKCPRCGYNNPQYNNFCEKCGFGIRQSIPNRNNSGVSKEAKIIIAVFATVGILLTLILFLTGNIKTTESTTYVKRNEPTTNAETQVQTKENVSELTEEEYKDRCSELWHDDILLTDDDLSGKLVKLNLLVEEIGTTRDTTFIEVTLPPNKQYHFKSDVLFCGIRNEIIKKDDTEDREYMGGGTYIYFFNNSEFSCRDFKLYDHITVYGEVLYSFEKDKTGYRTPYVVAKYIVNNGQ